MPPARAVTRNSDSVFCILKFIFCILCFVFVVAGQKAEIGYVIWVFRDGYIATHYGPLLLYLLCQGLLQDCHRGLLLATYYLLLATCYLLQNDFDFNQFSPLLNPSFTLTYHPYMRRVVGILYFCTYTCTLTHLNLFATNLSNLPLPCSAHPNLLMRSKWWEYQAMATPPPSYLFTHHLIGYIRLCPSSSSSSSSFSSPS